MSDTIYSVIIVAKDYSRATIARIAALFKKPPEQIEIALAKGDIAAKKNLDQATAELLKNTIEEKTGAECIINPLVENFEDYTEVVKPAATKAHPRTTSNSGSKNVGEGKSSLISLPVIIGIIGVFSIIASAGYFYYRTTTPAYSIEQIRRAVNERDLKLFQKHVDYEGMISRGVHATTNQDSAESNSSNAGWGNKAQPLSEDSITETISKLTNQLEDSVEHGDKFPPSTEHSLNGIAASLHEVLREGKAPGAQAFVRFPEFEDKAFTLNFELRKEAAYWRIVELENLAELLDWQVEQEANYLAKANEAVRERLTASINQVKFDHKTIPATPFLGPELRITMSLVNTSEKIIKTIYCNIDVMRADNGQIVATQYFSWGNGKKQLGAGKTAQIIKDIPSRASPELKELLSKPNPAFKFNYEISSISFADGSELIPYQSFLELP